MSRHIIKRTTVRLPAELLRTAQRKAAAEGRTLTALMEDGLRYIVSEKPAGEKQKRLLPRVSTATGGLRPGVSLDKFSTYQEMEDLEYFEKLKRGFQ
jgi:hypothetical protein